MYKVLELKRRRYVAAVPFRRGAAVKHASAYLDKELPFEELSEGGEVSLGFKGTGSGVLAQNNSHPVPRDLQHLGRVFKHAYIGERTKGVWGGVTHCHGWPQSYDPRIPTMPGRHCLHQA